MSISAKVPAILYFSDVPVESSFHGSALIYRLFQDYPQKKILVVEGGVKESSESQRLPQVKYLFRPLIGRQLINTRINKGIISALPFLSLLYVKTLQEIANNYECDAVVTVVHGYSWIAAATFAQKHNIPLHLFVHDDWVRVYNGSRLARQWMDRKLGECYRSANMRYCVSPFMVEEFDRRYGAKGTVLYPLRNKWSTCFQGPPQRLLNNNQTLTVSFAGTINSKGYAKALIFMANALRVIGGRLKLYGPLTLDQARSMDLMLENVDIMGAFDSKDLIDELRATADVLFVPMSFQREDRDNMMMGFPSKLADYTSLGIPLLIYGPRYCSAVRWATENPGVAIVLEEENESRLVDQLRDLISNPSLRMQLGSHAYNIGNDFFSYDKVVKQFVDSLMVENGLPKW